MEAGHGVSHSSLAPLCGGEQLRVAEQRVDVQLRGVQRRLQRSRLLLQQRQHVARARRRPPEELCCCLCLALQVWGEAAVVLANSNICGL